MIGCYFLTNKPEILKNIRTTLFPGRGFKVNFREKCGECGECREKK